MSAQVKGQESMAEEECTRKTPAVPTSTDETEDGISLLNAQISNVKYQEVFPTDTK